MPQLRYLANVNISAPRLSQTLQPPLRAGTPARDTITAIFSTMNGTVNATSNTFASGTSVPLFKHHGTFLVVKYRSLIAANVISADGNIIYGWGLNPDNLIEMYKVVLDLTPTPTPTPRPSPT